MTEHKKFRVDTSSSCSTHTSLLSLPKDVVITILALLDAREQCAQLATSRQYKKWLMAALDLSRSISVDFEKDHVNDLLQVLLGHCKRISSLAVVDSSIQFDLNRRAHTLELLRKLLLQNPKVKISTKGVFPEIHLAMEQLNCQVEEIFAWGRPFRPGCLAPFTSSLKRVSTYEMPQRDWENLLKCPQLEALRVYRFCDVPHASVLRKCEHLKSLCLRYMSDEINHFPVLQCVTEFESQLYDLKLVARIPQLMPNLTNLCLSKELSRQHVKIIVTLPNLQALCISINSGLDLIISTCQRLEYLKLIWGVASNGLEEFRDLKRNNLVINSLLWLKLSRCTTKVIPFIRAMAPNLRVFKHNSTVLKDLGLPRLRTVCPWMDFTIG